MKKPRVTIFIKKVIASTNITRIGKVVERITFTPRLPLEQV